MTIDLSKQPASRPHANGYRDWILGIAITALAIGGLVWTIGFFTNYNNRFSFSTNTAGLGELAVGGSLIQAGVLLFVLWLAVSAILRGMRRL